MAIRPRHLPPPPANLRATAKPENQRRVGDHPKSTAFVEKEGGVIFFCN